jgi:preprotein translocase subunit SecF
MTYSQAANLAVNQTLVRSINTSIIALLPVAALLLIGAGFLGAGTLKDLALALFVGIAAGTYSSVFIATPLAANLAERSPAMKALARRVESRRAGGSATSGAARRQRGAGGATVLAPEIDELDGEADVSDVPKQPAPRGASAAGGQAPRPRAGGTPARTPQRRPQQKRRPAGKKRK